MGREICGYTIATDLSIASARNAAKTAQSLIYESAGYWLPIVDVSLAEKSFIIEHTALTGGEGFYVTVSDECVRISCEFLSKFESETVAFFTRFIKAGSGDINFTDKINYTKNLRDVCYADFGASGNGIKDDYDAIRAAHEYANSEPGHKVIASEGATYYIGKGHTSSAEIKTDTDWKNAKFIIDDSEIAPFLSDGVTENPERTMWIFQIVYTKSWYSVSKALRPSSLAKGTKNIGIAPGETAIVRVTNSNHKNYIRYGVNANSGSSQREVVLIDKDGNVLDNTELLWDFEAITEISVIPVEETPLTVSGGFFITVYNQAPSEYTSYARGIRISRSNVTLKNVIHRITDEGEHGAPMSGFTSISYANNVVIDNIEFDNPKSFYSMGSGGGMAVMGSYEISAVGSTNTTWQNCTQYDFWSDETKTYAAQSGIMGTNYCKNMNYINMTVGSFDAHQGAQNIRIIGGNIEHINAIGGGELYIEGTRIHSMYQACAVILRNDYGSLWNGNATFKDVTLVTGDLDSVALFEAYWYNHDFGYKASMPQTVTLENLRIESNKDIKTLDFVRGSAKTQASLKFWDPDVLQIDSATGEYAKNKNVYSLPERWIIKDCEGYTYVMPEEFYEVVLIEYK